MSEEERSRPVIENDDDEDGEQSCCSQFLTKIGCSFVAKVVYKWPRTCGLLFGVVSQVFWIHLIASLAEIADSILIRLDCSTSFVDWGVYLLRIFPCHNGSTTRDHGER